MISSNLEIPFNVQTFNADVQVLGTTFNVKAWPNSKNPVSTVTLVTGKVTLNAREDPDATFTLSPGQTRSVGFTHHGVSEVNQETIRYALEWRKGDLVYRKKELIVVLEDIERQFGISLVLDAQELAEKEFTFVYRQAGSAEEVIESLCHALGLRYRPIANGYELFEM